MLSAKRRVTWAIVILKSICGAIALLWACGTLAQESSESLTASELAIVINTRDPLSVAVGEYYQRRRRIPPENVARIELDPTQTSVEVAKFQGMRDAVLAGLPVHIQAYALTWAQPYRVACMSITSAFAFGFDPGFCSERCERTRSSPYYASTARRPYQQLGMRLAMSIAARDFGRARELIDRGIAADDSDERGTAYLVTTADARRNVRATGYEDMRRMFASRIPIEIEHAAALEGKRDVMFYFIGAAQVSNIESNRFLPGAVADHLTSLGGQLTDSSQMSSLHWLEVGATGSYGTVMEPCNFPGKFPSPVLLMKHYLAGETLIEAYWKSVAMPGQGIFIGEPLARPFHANQVKRGTKHEGS